MTIALIIIFGCSGKVGKIKTQNDNLFRLRIVCMADAVCANMSMMIAATSLGVGSCYLNQLHCRAAYGGFEKVGDLPQSLPTNDEQISTVPGDVILYQGRKFVFYYRYNNWNLTRLGRIDGVTKEALL